MVAKISIIDDDQKTVSCTVEFYVIDKCRDGLSILSDCVRALNEIHVPVYYEPDGHLISERFDELQTEISKARNDGKK